LHLLAFSGLQLSLLLLFVEHWLGLDQPQYYVGFVMSTKSYASYEWGQLLKLVQWSRQREAVETLRRLKCKETVIGDRVIMREELDIISIK